MIVASAHGVKTPWKPCGGVLSCRHESIITHGCSASLVRRRRVLLWRSRHRRQRAWLGPADLPGRLSRGRIAPKKLIERIPKWAAHAARVLVWAARPNHRSTRSLADTDR